MNITLKQFKHLARLSEETLCFTAQIHINGYLAGFAMNRGHGGETIVNIKDPAIRDKHTDAEWMELIDALTFKELEKKETARLTKRIQKQLAVDIIFTRKGDEFKGRHFVFKKGNLTPEIAQRVRAKIAAMPDADLILNDQPIEVAFAHIVTE